jgi:hypothetical protein
MCDYSLHSIENRLANVGERLVVHRFRTGSLGLVAEADAYKEEAPRPQAWKWLLEIAAPARLSECAVCIPPGARLLLRDIPQRIQFELGVRTEEEVCFTQLTAATNAYRDAVRFSGGAELLLQRLKPGQRVDVLSLSLAQDELQPVAVARRA